MRMGFFKAFGVLTLFLSPLARFATMDSTGSFDGRGLIAFSAVVVIGFGLIFLRKWAALYFSVPLFCYGFVLVLDVIEEVPFPFNLLAMCYGGLLMLPLVVTVKVWRHLTWRGKWFF